MKKKKHQEGEIKCDAYLNERFRDRKEEEKKIIIYIKDKEFIYKIDLNCLAMS